MSLSNTTVLAVRAHLNSQRPSISCGPLSDERDFMRGSGFMLFSLVDCLQHHVYLDLRREEKRTHTIFEYVTCQAVHDFMSSHVMHMCREID